MAASAPSDPRATARRLSEEVLAPHAAEVDSTRQFPAQNLRALECLMVAPIEPGIKNAHENMLAGNSHTMRGIDSLPGSAGHGSACLRSARSE